MADKLKAIELLADYHGPMGDWKKGDKRRVSEERSGRTVTEHVARLLIAERLAKKYTRAAVPKARTREAAAVQKVGTGPPSPKGLPPMPTT